MVARTAEADLVEEMEVQTVHRTANLVVVAAALAVDFASAEEEWRHSDLGHRSLVPLHKGPVRGCRRSYGDCEALGYHRPSLDQL
jgi:hypothetical protein